VPASYSALTVTTGATIAKTWGDDVRDSVITVHASYSALTSAITSPEEGMVSYLTDTDLMWFYKNSQWRLLPGQVIYSKRDTSTTFFSGQAAGTFWTAYTTSTITVPTGGAGQAFEIDWQQPAGSGAFTTGLFNSQLNFAVNGGAFNTLGKSGPVATNQVDVWPTKGQETWKQGVTDLTVQWRINVIAVGGIFDSIATAANPALLRMRSTGLLSTEVV
jgi:hypothetical protein